MEIKKIAVLGAGTMGNGITQVSAQSTFKVTMYDIDQKFLDRGMNTIKKNLGRSVEKGRMSQGDMDVIISRISTSLSLKEAVADADLVIESVPEIIDLKKDIFKQLDEICPKDTILASNSSGLSISEIASVTSRQDKVIGMHFWNPAFLMKLVEIIKGVDTSEETLNNVVAVGKAMGKEPVVAKDSAGFCGNRIGCPMINEAFFVLGEGIASAEDIDKAMYFGWNHPMGPLALADMIGLDIMVDVMNYFHKEMGDKYRPAPLMVQLVRAGRLGRKTGKGVYDYTQK